MNQTKEKTWVSVKEYAELVGISERAVRKNIAASKYQVKEIPHPKRADQVTYLVYAEPECGTSYAEPIAEPECGTSYAEPIAEPECGTSYAEPTTDNLSRADNLTTDATTATDATTEAAEADNHIGYQGEVLGGSVAAGAVLRQAKACAHRLKPASPPAKACAPRPARPPAKSSVPDGIAYHKIGEAQLFALFMDEVERRLVDSERRGEEWERIAEDYNRGELVAELRKLKGRRTERGLRHWYQKWRESGNDMFELVHKNNAEVRGRKVTHIEQCFLRAALLCGWEKPVMNAIGELKMKAAQGVLESPSSVATLKRWVRDFSKSEPAAWIQGRRGDKAVMEDVVKSIQRDDSSIEPLSVFVVDGHKLNVFVKHPITGKPFRPVLIMVMDWGTRYPLGMSLALSEDSAHTLTAFRNAFLHAGVLPWWVLLDNGKAFRSKLFNEKWEEHDLEREFAGIFPRLGIDAHFARAYNAKAKVIERLFRTLTDQWASRQKSYCGRDIKDKPAHFQRNEKWMQEMYGADAMDYEECMHSIYEWVRWEYGMRVHSTTKRKPYEHFMEAARDAERVVDPVKLNVMMLVAERVRLRSEGITLNKNRYWAPELVDHVGNRVVIRYDYNDLRSILVYDERSRFICQAELRESQSAWVWGEQDNPMVTKRLWAENREIEGLKRGIRQKTKKLANYSKREVDKEIARHQGLIDERKAEVRENNPAFKQGPMMPEVVKRVDVNEEIAELEELARASSGAGEERSLEETDKVIVLEDLLGDADDGGDLAGVVSFEEMQKIIGLDR